METSLNSTANNSLINSAQMLAHWQAHRGLTRKVIEAYPEEHLFTYAIGGMRPFAQLAMEMIDLADGGITGIATGQWNSLDEMSHVNGPKPGSKQELLKLWDEVTNQIERYWGQITPNRFNAVEAAFGMYEAANFSTLLYIIDNEIHHRGQAYVYLRSLGVTPPPFWER